MKFLNTAKRNPQKSKIPRSVQASIPFLKEYENGIIEVKKGFFSKSIEFNDINYQIAKQDEQESIFMKYGEFLNYFDPTVKIQVTINNKKVNQTELENDIFIKQKNDSFKKQRREYNSIIKKQAAEGGNDTKKEKYITLTSQAKDIKQAEADFTKLEIETISLLKKMGSSGRVLSTEERLKILHDFYNQNSNDILDINLEELKKQGISSKDLIAPDGMLFKNDYIQIGDKFVRGLYLKVIPAYAGDKFISDITNFNFNMITSIHIEGVSPVEALKIVNRQISNIKQDKMQQQKKAFKDGYGSDLVSDDIEDSLIEAKELLDDLNNKNQKMFLMSLVIVHSADTLEELNRDTIRIQNEAGKVSYQIGKLMYQQEDGLASALPVGDNRLYIKRTLTTESTAVFIPFTSQELFDNSGVYYGLNAVTYNLIMFNRKALKNPNGFILGTPGSGKSFAAKREMVNVLLNTDDDIIVIDPEREYGVLASNFDGEIINISATSKNYINPLDMSKDYSDDEDPLILKSDFILSLCELIIGVKSGLSPQQRTIIDRSVKQTYFDYIESNYSEEKLPTLQDFYNTILKQPEIEAKDIALSLELYIQGSLSVFANKSNVDVNNRFIVFDIKDLGKQLKNMGLLICLDSVWNRIIENRKKGKRTWIYFDEAHILFKNEFSASFLYELYKRARKWGGIPTGITQNVEELLDSDLARKMISNSDFIMMLNQASLDREILAEILSISETQLNFVTNAPEGQGLLFVGNTIVPFIDRFPTNTELYKMMTTKPDDGFRA